MKYVLNTGAQPGAYAAVDFKKDLNEAQFRVVTEGDGPCLVLAGAGSGKTRTLVYRVAYLLSKGVNPENILLVTFTNKASHTMQDRVEMLLKAKPNKLWSGTFHHIGNRSLRMYAKELGYKPDFGILDEEDSKDLIRVCIKNLDVKVSDERIPTPKVMRTIISYSINSGRTIQRTLMDNYPYFMPIDSLINKIAKEYETRKKMSNMMDYDDLLTKWLWMLENVHDAKKRFATQFRYILVDEYQDTNKLQAAIIKQLSDVHKNVLVVGDDAQSIYSFRGADVSNILNFPDVYDSAKVFKLEVNYRSTPEILTLANNSIEHNDNQFDKKLKPVKEGLSKPALIEVTDTKAQAAFVVQRILELRDEGIPMSEMAVLFRAHYQSADVEMELVKRNIPYVIRGGVRFFEQAHIKDVLSFMRIIANPEDELAWVRALGLSHGIGAGYAGKVFDEFMKTKDINEIFKTTFDKFLPPRARTGFNQFRRVMGEINDKSILDKPDEMIKRIIEKGYEEYARTHFENAKDRIEDLHELVNFAHQYKTLSTFLHDITLRESFKGETITEAPSHEETIVLSTIHQAKGLEWRTVFVIGLCEGQFPHAKSIEQPMQLEEERRLFYVAVTRAKDELYMIHPLTRYDYQMGVVISRKSIFVQELNRSDYDRWEIEEREGGGGLEVDIDLDI